MGDNNEQEHADLAAMNDDGGDLVDVDYRGGRPVNLPNVPFRLIIHASVTKIHMHTFHRCHMLREVIFRGTNVTLIGRLAFGNCHNLQHIELPAGLLFLEYGAFDGCTSLQQIVIPATVQYIGELVFCGCTSLESVVFVPRTTSIELGYGMFTDCTNLRIVTLPQHLQSIPARYFQDCILLTHLHIPVSVEEIEERAFWGSGIQATKISEEDEFIPGTIILPPKLRSISEKCFEGCMSFTNIRIPPSVERFGKQCFKGSAIHSIVMSNNVHTGIDQEAFKDCAFLERVTIHSTNLTMGNNIFTNCPLLSVIMIAPWMWPKLFASMNGQPDFIIKFFRQYHTQIFDFETPVVRRPLRRG